MAQGKITLSSGTLRLNGNILLQDEGRFVMTGATLAFESVFRYQHGFTASGMSSVELNQSNITSNGFNLNGGFTDSAQFVVKDTTFQAGLTTGLFLDAKAEVDGSNPLEWVLQDNASLKLSNNEGPFIVWPIFPDGSQADLTFPSSTPLENFELSDETPLVSGLGLSMTLENLGQVWWGLMLRTGADVTVRDSNMRTTGIIVDHGQEVSLSGLVDGSHYEDQTFDFSGSQYHLVNTTVDTWNVYAWGADSLKMDNCLFGELGALSVSETTLKNCLIDGTGGYLFTEGDTGTTLLGCSVLSDAIARGSSTLVMAYSSLMNGDVVATDQSALVLLNSLTEREPQCRDSGLVIDLNVVPPQEPVVDALLELNGNAFMAHGPEFPLDVDHWQLFFAAGDGSKSNWIPIGGPQTSRVRQGLLGVWNTSRLVPGAYTLRLNMVLEGGFSFDTSRYVFLAASRGASSSVMVPHIASSSAWESTLTADNLGGQKAQLKLYQYLNGELVSSLTDDLSAFEQKSYRMAEGTHAFALAMDADIAFRETFVHSQEEGMAEFALTGEAGETRFFLIPHYMKNALSWLGFAALNTSGRDAEVSFAAFSETGEILGESSRVIPAFQRMVDQWGGIFQGIEPMNIARIKAVCDQPINGLTLSGWNNERLLFTRAIEVPTGDMFILPHIANDWQNWVNRLVLDNLAEEDRDVQVELYSAGVRVDTKNLNILPGQTGTLNLNLDSGLNPQWGLIRVPASEG
jgi:hypothetical protein